jgi:hypothetical protein
VAPSITIFDASPLILSKDKVVPCLDSADFKRAPTAAASWAMADESDTAIRKPDRTSLFRRARRGDMKEFPERR